jgi:predicted 2-oxoglutarate/Fe(II)-dependent dioxygenase YbiX
MKIADDIYTESHVFSNDECRSYVERCESIGFEAASLSMFGSEVRRPDVRNNDRVILDDADLATEIWTRVNSYVPAAINNKTAISLNSRLRFYRYDVGQKFAPHFDGAYRSPDGAVSLLTFMLYLNEGYEGGETVFGRITIAPETGKILIFKHELVHQSTEIRKGRKYVLRSDVMFV